VTPGAHPLVLAYHSVARKLAAGLLPSMVTLADELVGHVALLRSAGYRIVTAGELADELDAGGSGAGAAVLTFDDGWADALTLTAPLLASLGVRATFFLAPGLFGNEDRTMSAEGRILTAEEARALHGCGMELGAHSLHHPDLRTLDDGALDDELRGSRAAVEQLTGRPCRVLAYPFGVHDRRVREATRAAGFSLAFTYAEGPWSRLAAPRMPAPPAGEPLVLPRRAEAQ
jgi:peptidoglycan/xylan/chitin deacetylase (PgdA/CDA1 family)